MKKQATKPQTKKISVAKNPVVNTCIVDKDLASGGMLPKQYRVYLIFGVIIQTCLLAIIAWLYLHSLQYVELLQQNNITISKLSEQANKQQADIESFKTKIEKNSELATQKNNQFVLLQSYALVQAAKFDLMIEKNTNSAILLLEEADKNLSKLDEQTIIKIRNAILHDIHELRVVKNIDLSAGILQIESLQQQFAKLDLLFVPLNSELKKPQDVVNNSPVNSRWKLFVSNALAVFKSAFVIRQKQQPILPLLNVEQRESLIFGLQNKLELSKWALLNKQPVIFNSNIQQVLDVLQQYRSQFISLRLTLLEEKLKELQKIDFSSNLPGLDSSEQAFTANLTGG